MALQDYRRKRDFTITSEPSGEAAPRAGGFSFVVQKHAARRLHYDFRLEMDGVLKSWAVAKGPSLVAGEKRLAVHVEDHPLDYGDFEGSIPAGQYGAGTVIVWDRGTWTPAHDPEKGYAKGHLDFELHGEKLKGAWHLVRMHGKPGEKHENWLLIKSADDAARPAGAPDVLQSDPLSVKSGRSLESAAKPAPSARARRAAMPGFLPPALATPSPRPPAGPGWLHEIKFDGYRVQAHLADGGVHLLTRSGLDWTAKFGEAIATEIAGLPTRTAIIDGEIIAENAQGAADFSALQQALSDGRTAELIYYAFDLLFLDGTDMRKLPLGARKTALHNLLKHQNRVRFSEDFGEEGALMLRHACRLHLEGIVSKRRDSTYPTGRSPDWRKSKCDTRQELVIAGFVPGKAGPGAIGSLVLGYYHDGALVHAGRCGTGFSQRIARDLHARLAPLETRTSPFARALPAPARAGVHFVAPELVAEIAFTGWTADGSVRHASFQGLREDKQAAEVVRESELTPDPPDPPDPPAPAPAAAPARAARSGHDAAPCPATRSAIRLTHPDRVYWPDCGVTKAELAAYYERVWPRIEFFVANRPLSMLRCPDGVGETCFFQKHVWKGASRAVHVLHDPHGKAGAELVSIADFDGMMGLVQAGVLEIHPWGSTLADPEHPDFITIDLDPGPGITWPDITTAAREVRGRLEQAGLAAFVKTSGGKGLHIVAPLSPVADWAEAKAFTKSLAESMARDTPARYVSVVTKAKREGRILIDYLRNGRGQTAVAPYSTRARAGAPISMPVRWAEIDKLGGAAVFNLRGALPKADAWADFAASAAPLPRGD